MSQKNNRNVGVPISLTELSRVVQLVESDLATLTRRIMRIEEGLNQVGTYVGQIVNAMTAAQAAATSPPAAVTEIAAEVPEPEPVSLNGEAVTAIIAA